MHSFFPDGPAAAPPACACGSCRLATMGALVHPTNEVLRRPMQSNSTSQTVLYQKERSQTEDLA